MAVAVVLGPRRHASALSRFATTPGECGGLARTRTRFSAGPRVGRAAHRLLCRRAPCRASARRRSAREARASGERRDPFDGFLATQKETKR
jgi:hypothetical protein